MKDIIKYVADDGTEFTVRQDCITYEEQCNEVLLIMKELPTHPDTCDFSNGSGYLQHEDRLLEVAKFRLLTLAHVIMPNPIFKQAITNSKVHHSHPGRLIGEMQNKALRRAWHRFECIDTRNREWGQPYFANNQHEAIPKQLN